MGCLKKTFEQDILQLDAMLAWDIPLLCVLSVMYQKQLNLGSCK